MTPYKGCPAHYYPAPDDAQLLSQLAPFAAIVVNVTPSAEGSIGAPIVNLVVWDADGDPVKRRDVRFVSTPAALPPGVKYYAERFATWAPTHIP